MYAFTFERPSSTADAARLAGAGGKLLAGGQTLLASMKQRLSDPGQLVDLGRIKELAGIRKEGDALVIGAMTRHADVAASAWPLTSRVSVYRADSLRRAALRIR